MPWIQPVNRHLSAPGVYENLNLLHTLKNLGILYKYLNFHPLLKNNQGIGQHRPKFLYGINWLQLVATDPFSQGKRFLVAIGLKFVLNLKFIALTLARVTHVCHLPHLGGM